MKIRYFLRLLRQRTLYIFDAVGNRIFAILRFFRITSRANMDFNHDKIKRILIIRLDRIGDMVLSTPAFNAVRTKFPDAAITLLLRPYTKDLVINNKSIDKIITFDKYHIIRTLRAIWNLDVDLAIALSHSFLANLLTFYSGATHRVGYAMPCGTFFLTKRAPTSAEFPGHHRIELYLNVIRELGIDVSRINKEPSVTVREEGEVFAEEFFSDNKISRKKAVIVHPGARQSYIRWRKDGFAEVSDKMIDEFGVQVILIGSQEESRLVDEVRSFMKNKPILAVGLPLTSLISLTKRCCLFVGNSTGPMHIASALKIPVVSLFGSTHPYDSYRAWGPWGTKHIVVSKNLDCKNCHPGDCKHYDCMRLITSDDVFQAARSLLKM